MLVVDGGHWWTSLFLYQTPKFSIPLLSGLARNSQCGEGVMAGRRRLLEVWGEAFSRRMLGVKPPTRSEGKGV